MEAMNAQAQPMNKIDALGTYLIHSSRSVGDFFELLRETFLSMTATRIRWRQVMEQLYFIGNGSLFIIVFCVCFAAMVTILESSFHIKLVIQNDALVPGFAAVLILRELGSVVTALLLTSRVGAGYAAEIGSMQITEQIDALKMLGVDPIRYLVVPRFIAGMLGTLMLVIVADMVCILCSILVCETYLGFTTSMFMTAMRRFVFQQDFFFSMIKAVFFGGVIPLVSAFFGFRCRAGAQGVGEATTQSVVIGSILIILLDFILSFTFSYFY